MMKAALFIPCYVDAVFPEVGIATLELLERLGVEVAYPLNQTCCGQPMANSGCHDDAAAAEALFVKNFAGYDYIVGPSGSCVHHVRENLTAIPQTPETAKVRRNTYELVEFLHDVLKVRRVSLGRISAHGRLAQRLRVAARAAHRQDVRDRRAVLLEAARSADQGERHPVRHAGASRRVLRVRRNVFGVRGAGLGQDGLRQGERPSQGRRGIHRVRRHVLHHASEGMRGAARPADQVHPHRADPEWGHERRA